MRSMKLQTLSFASILFTAVFCCVASEKNLEDARSSEVPKKSEAAVGIEVKRVKDAKTVEALRNAFAAGDIMAGFALADMYWSGEVSGWVDWGNAWDTFRKAVNIDPEKALTLLRKGCDKGDAACYHYLGIMHANGWGVARDQAKAVELYQKACDGGNAPACYSLGQALRLGQGVPKDDAKALVAYQKSCDGNYAPGCYKAAYMYENGFSVPTNAARALQLYEQSCAYGDAGACHKVGTMYLKGQGAATNEAKAAEFLKKAADAGSQQARKDLQALIKPSN